MMQRPPSGRSVGQRDSKNMGSLFIIERAMELVPLHWITIFFTVRVKVLRKVWPGFKYKYDLDVYDLR